jgi:hypothetical protein
MGMGTTRQSSQDTQQNMTATAQQCSITWPTVRQAMGYWPVSPVALTAKQGCSVGSLHSRPAGLDMSALASCLHAGDVFY